MNFKPKLKYPKYKLKNIVFPLALAGAIFTNVAHAQSPSASEMLTQALNNIANIQNYTYNLKVQDSSPLLDLDATIDGKMSAYLMESHGNFGINSWIFQKPYRFDFNLYLDVTNMQDPQIYGKLTPDETAQELLNMILMDKEFNPKAFYKFNLEPAQLVNSMPVSSQIQDPVKILKYIKNNITNVKLISATKDNAKISFTYNLKIIDSKLWNEQLLNAIDTDQMKLVKSLRKLEEDPLFKSIYDKVYPIEITVDISKKDKYIHHVAFELSPMMEELSKDVYSSTDDSKWQIGPNINMASISKNYIAQSVITFDLDLTNINSTDIKEIPQEVIDSAIPVDLANIEKPIEPSGDSVSNEDPATNADNEEQEAVASETESSTEEPLPFPEPMNLDSGIIGQMENYDKVSKALAKEAQQAEKQLAKKKLKSVKNKQTNAIK